MAQPIHQSPRRLFGDRSPPRPQSGLSISLHDQPALAQAKGQRQMLPPSPQTYQPRFPYPPAVSNGHNPQNVIRDLPPPQQRPSSSMSISSMLGSEPDKPSRDQQPAATSSTPSPYHPKVNNQFSEMSPLQPAVKATPGAAYAPRSQTPDRMGIPNLLGTRPYRSGSGSFTQGSAPFGEPVRASSRTSFPQFGETAQPPQSQEPARRIEESLNLDRKTSLSGILQRPSSQPQPQGHSSGLGNKLDPVNQPRQVRPGWPEHSNSQSSVSFGSSFPQPSDVKQAVENRISAQNGQSASATHAATQYDTRPPGFTQQQPSAVQDRGLQPRASTYERPASHPTSPESRRQTAAAAPQFRPLGGLLNGQPPTSSSQTPENHQATSVPMGKQDSSQSHAERFISGERLDKTRSKLFSPFAGSHTSHGATSASVPLEEQSRKGSDELSQHRALLGLAAEGKRGGRYSPLPQAVQGAQAQSLGPELGIKTEHGRIFSGIGSVVGAVSATPAHGPAGLAASPFKRDDNGSRVLSEDNLMRISRSTSGFGKRPRKVKEEDGKAASETEGHGRAGKRPRNHHHHFRLENGDLSSPFDLQRRNTPLSSLNPIRRGSPPTHGGSSSSTHHHHHRPHHHHHHQPPPPPKQFKPSTTIKIKAVVDAAAKNPRRHLGSFLYSPTLSVPDLHTPVRTKLNISIRPNLIPSFKDPLNVNHTYTIRVSRTWLRHSEREAICAERFLWGSGIYADDSDPVAAAIHSGFIKGAWGESVDTALLEQVIKQQNPCIDVRDNVPDTPVDPPAEKDLHITLLVLPQLEKYAASVRYGIKSRSWPEEAKDAPHDGCSFMVLKCAWLDEGSTRGQERSGQARRKRLRALMVERPPESVTVA